MPGNSASNTTTVIALLFLSMLTPSTTAQSLPEPPAAATELDYDQVTAYIPQAQGKRVFDLVMRFGTSQSPKRTRSSTAY
jgi:hypothetical protein